MHVILSTLLQAVESICNFCKINMQNLWWWCCRTCDDDVEFVMMMLRNFRWWCCRTCDDDVAEFVMMMVQKWRCHNTARPYVLAQALISYDTTVRTRIGAYLVRHDRTHSYRRSSRTILVHFQDNIQVQWMERRYGRAYMHASQRFRSDRPAIDKYKSVLKPCIGPSVDIAIHDYATWFRQLHSRWMYAITTLF